MPDPIRVLVADDQQLLRAGFRVILESEPDIVVVGEAADGVEAIERARETGPDVVLMDIRMPRLDGLTATERLGELTPPPRVVVLTTFDENPYIVRALRAGASGFLLKDAPATRMVAAVRAAAAGESLIEPSITRRLLERFAANDTDPTGASPVLRALTDREREVLRLMARGMSNAEIAGEMIVGETTVKTHVARILAKLGLRDRVQAVILAYESGLVGQ